MLRRLISFALAQRLLMAVLTLGFAAVVFLVNRFTGGKDQR